MFTIFYLIIFIAHLKFHFSHHSLTLDKLIKLLQALGCAESKVVKGGVKLGITEEAGGYVRRLTLRTVTSVQRAERKIVPSLSSGTCQGPRRTTAESVWVRRGQVCSWQSSDGMHQHS